MIDISNVDIYGWAAAIRGMRNPMNSWDKSNSCFNYHNGYDFTMGKNDLKLMQNLVKAGSDHGKFLRMINVTCDIVAPLYWWSEYDTYKVGTVANSCSKMHKLLAKPFKLIDFSFDKLFGYEEVARQLVDMLNELRDSYLACENEESKKQIWYSILQLLPSSYNQRRTVQLNYEVLQNMYFARKNHKLDEWRTFCTCVETLPYFKAIFLTTCKDDEEYILEDK